MTPDLSPAEAEIRRSIGELFADEGNAPLLGMVLCYMPPTSALGVAMNAGLVVINSLPLQLSLRRIYHQIEPGHLLHSKEATSAQKLRWLLEWQRRHDLLRPHYSLSVGEEDEEFVQIDGGLQLCKQSAWHETDQEYRATLVVSDINPAAGTVQHPTRAPEDEYSECAISAKDDLLVSVSRNRVVLRSVNGAARDVWRLRFRRLTSPSGGLESENVGNDDHPEAALPIIDVATPRDPAPRDPYTFLGIDVGPNGLLIFHCQYTEDQRHRHDILLNWKTGEGLGYFTTSPVTSWHARQHAFVGDQHLLSAVFRLDQTELSGSRRGACLWLSALPKTGCAPHRLSNFKSITGKKAEQHSFSFLLEDLPRIQPDAAFWLPPFVESQGPTASEGDGGYDPWFMYVSTSQTPSDPRTDASLALFSITGCVDINISLGMARHVQCSGLLRVADLLSIVSEAEAEIDKAERSASRWFVFRWEEWEWCTDVFFLNSHLTPVLRGAKVIFGYSAGDEAEGPVVVGGRPEKTAVRVPNLTLAFRDYSPRSLVGQEAPSWRPFGVPRTTGPSSTHLDYEGDGHGDVCTKHPMTVHSTCVVFAPVPQDTRGMFAVSTMGGQLPYTETLGSLPRQVLLDLKKEKHPGSELAFRVKELAYDGENLIVVAYGMRFVFAFTPRRKDADGCCGSQQDTVPKSVKHRSKTTKKPRHLAAKKRRR